MSGQTIDSGVLLALRIRNLIAAREFNTAEANHELSRGGWLSDHRHEDNILSYAIDELIEKANAQSPVSERSGDSMHSDVG